MKPYTVFLIDNLAVQAGFGKFGYVCHIDARDPEHAAQGVPEGIFEGPTVVAVIAGTHEVLYSDPINEG